MASKGPRCKLDHETRAKRQKALEAPKEPRRPKTHWDHVLEEMVWLSKDFELERKWKLAQAKRVALRASKGMLDQATRGEKKLKEEEQRLRKVALNISKDVKKFWMKIEKLVLYKHQMELDEKKKKALDKQLEFLLGQTERYSTMLAENLVDSHKPLQHRTTEDRLSIKHKGIDNVVNEAADIDEDYDIRSEDESEDDEHTLEKDEALITEEERKEELAALHDEVNLPLEELLKRYAKNKVGGECSAENDEEEEAEHGWESEEEEAEQSQENDKEEAERSQENDGEEAECSPENDEEEAEHSPENDEEESEHSPVNNEKETARTSEKDEEAEPQSRESTPEMDGDRTEPTSMGELRGKGKANDLSAVSEINRTNSVMATGRRCDETNGDSSILENDLSGSETCPVSELSKIAGESAKHLRQYDFSDEQEDADFVVAAGEEKDDEATLLEEEELAKTESSNPMDEIALLQEESEIPVEELLARYKKAFSDNEVTDEESDYASAMSDNLMDSPLAHEDIQLERQSMSMDEDVETGEVMHSPAEKQQVEPHEETEEGMESENRIADAAAAARSAQPTGNTFSTTKVRTKFPFLIKHPLREYQHIGLDWLVTMYEKRLNGILADEMGLGKTIMTIALLAHLACEKGIWGPHLIVVPTSVMLNWETEFLKWCPAFKILTYFGSAKERKYKRQGWLKPNSFHVCITTYRLVIQDSKVFKRKKWKYLILDEAHLIKNWKSQRWQTLLNFNSKRRILLTGTPLQNDLMELWSLMHFLMPHIFQSHQEFKDWFSNPISGMVEGQEKINKEVVDRLHNVLRPFILRRLKRDVEKQLPMKHEHVIYCRLSKRQRNLYEDFIASSETQATLASANFFGMISVIMQLRKVCNHPDLFEGRPIVSSFDIGGIDIQLSSSICSMLSPGPYSNVDLTGLGFLFTHLDFSMASWESDEVKALATPSSLIKERSDLCSIEEIGPGLKHRKRLHGTNIFEEISKAIMEERLREAKERAAALAWWNSLRCEKKPIYSTTLRKTVRVEHPVYDIHRLKANPLSSLYSSKLADIVLSPVERFGGMLDLVESFMFAIPAARAPPPLFWCSKSGSSVFLQPTYKQNCSELLSPLLSPIRPAIVRRQVYFPDRRLIQFDCGKLQQLAVLLRKLKSEGHRALIFTQMTKMLDILEAFINLYGYTYMRLDGSTPPEERQTLMQRFNTNPKIFLFILSTRSGGVGINLVGADTVIFYDSDWNPAMDQQAQDRCHRIGQTREVHIYRLISESTIEENILKKANQKRALDDLVIQSGGYNTEFFKKLDPMELFSGHRALQIKNLLKEKNNNNGNEVSVSIADVEAALKYAEDEADYMALKKVEQEEAVENQEFTEEAIAKVEDDEFANEDDLKVDEPGDQNGCITTSIKETGVILNGGNPSEDRAPAVAGKEDDVDMLADVKQMAAAAAAAGQAILSFENQLRPIDRYAIRFLEFWDPIIDKSAVESQVRFEETEWELDRIERFKDEMEAEIDEDEEPLVYERWDAEFATEAYRQQVEALAQHQLMEELECEAREKEAAEDDNGDSMKNETSSDPKPKSKKKPKKAKFKSLKKGSLASELKTVKEEIPTEPMSTDDEAICHEMITSDGFSSMSSVPKKRKKAESILDSEEEKTSKKKSKKTKKHGAGKCPLDLESNLSGVQQDEIIDSKLCENVVDIEQRPMSRSRMGGKVSITTMPVKRVLMIKPEKLKKANIWSKECVPSPDFWLPQEDAILCAVVHEYGPHWSLVSDTLYGMTAGGYYRGRYRHPVHCCERFRELIQRYVLSAPDNPNIDKVSNTGSGKALLKVTEDNIRVLLDVAAEQPDREFLIQKHFTALLSSVWKATLRVNRRPSISSPRNGLHLGGRFFNSSVSRISQNSLWGHAERIKFTNLGQSSKMLAAALHDANHRGQDERVSLPNHGDDTSASTEQLDITLEFPDKMGDAMAPLPSVISLSISGAHPPPPASNMEGEDHNLKSFQNMAENRFRASARACVEDSLGWASSVFPTNDVVRSRSATKLPSLGKHKLPICDSMRPPKSKLKRSSMEQGETADHTAETVSGRSPAAALKDPSIRFESTEPMMADVGIDNVEGILPCSMDIGVSTEMESFEVVSHEYVPGLISGLDDCPLLPEYTDIG